MTAGADDGPTVADYLAFAASEACTVEFEPLDADYGRVTITAPDGRQVVEIVEALEDRLVSTTIARLDRRLGVKSHFFV